VLARHSRLFCLDATPAELSSRLAGAANRPLLNARPPAQSLDDRITELLAQREAAYALIPRHIQTDGLSAAQVAGQVVASVHQGAIRDLQRSVHAGSETYQVEMGAGIWRILGQLLREPLDLMLVVGSSLVVYPAAQVPLVAHDAGAPLVILNAEPTPFDKLATVILRGRAGDLLPELVALSGQLKR